jgi:hypothetical protein
VILCTPVEAQQRFGGTYCLLLQGRREEEGTMQVAYLDYFSTLKIEAVYSTETLDNFYKLHGFTPKWWYSSQNLFM